MYLFSYGKVVTGKRFQRYRKDILKTSNIIKNLSRRYGESKV